MTVDSINIANGNANALVLKHQGKNFPNLVSQRGSLSNIVKGDSENSVDTVPTSQKSIFEINKSQIPLNKAIEASSDSLKSMLYTNVSHKSKIFPNTNFAPELLNETNAVQVAAGSENPALIEQSGWFITIVPDKKTNGGFLELTEKKEDRKRTLKDFYNPIVSFNKGKLLDLVI
jgi:hypothetical protein